MGSTRFSASQEHPRPDHGGPCALEVPTISLESHFQQLRVWLDMESDAERARMAERRKRRGKLEAESRGESLLNLVVVDHTTGLGGRFLLTFAPRNRGEPLPWNRLRVGSPVLVSPHDEELESLFGVVSRRTNEHIQVALEDWPEGDLFRLDLSADEVTRLRQLGALSNIQFARGRTAQLRDVLMTEREPKFDELKQEIEFLGMLNPSQQDAVRFALTARDLAIIHGPPGTGKTTTVIEIIRQAVRRGEKVLATAPSNTAVDHLLECLAPCRIRVVRIGHPARVQPTLQNHTLDALVENDPAMDLVRSLMRDAEQVSRQAQRYTRARPAPGTKQNLRQEAKSLRDDARRMERQIIAGILDDADVICATTTFDPEILGDRQFQLAVVDEACQTTEPGTWPVVQRAERIILAGDHCQLPPTILDATAAREGFNVSMMERLVKHYGEQVTRQLRVQYRMHGSIMEFSSENFYRGSLVADASVVDHRLGGLPGFSVQSFDDEPVRFIDTAGAEWDEELEPDGESKRNPREAELILRYADRLVAAGLPAGDIAVIAPYAAQVRWIRQRCPHVGLEIDTVDGFQGREKEAVLISLVRSNREREIGFLGDTRRMNVALTRARRLLVVVGDSSTLGSHDFYADLLQYFEMIGAYHSVWEEEIPE